MLSRWQPADSLKMLCNAKFDLQKAVENCIEHIAWRNLMRNRPMPNDAETLMVVYF